MTEDLLSTGYESETTDGFLAIDLTTIPDEVLIPANTEVEVEVKSVKLVQEKKYLDLRLRTIGLTLPNGVPNGFIHRLFLPKPDDDADKRQNKLGRIKEACLAFGITGVLQSPEDFVGRHAFGLIGVEPAQDGYPEKNNIRFTGLKK